MTRSATALQFPAQAAARGSIAPALALVASIWIAVLAFGGTEPITFSLVEILLFLAALPMLLSVREIPSWMPPAAVAVPALIVGIALFALCPLPRALVKIMGRPVASAAPWTHLTIAPYATRSQLLVLIACVVAFYLSMDLGSRRTGKRMLIYSLMALGLAEAFYGFVQYLGGVQKIFFYTRKYDLMEATGTFINRNHYAGLLEMIIPFGLALAAYEYTKVTRGGFRRHSSLKQSLSHENLSRAVLWLAITILLFIALIFSQSRMGIIASSVSLLGMIVLGKFKREGLVLALLLISGVAAAVFWVGAGPIATRFSTVDQEYALSEGSRLSIWRDTLKLVREHPLLGSGFGTFPIAYTSVQTTFRGNFVNHAHNDYLEFASDLGIPASIVLFASFLWLLASCLKKLRLEGDNFERMVCLGCAGAIIAILLHSMADFNLYIPGNALVFSSILGLAVSATHSKRPPRERISQPVELAGKRALDLAVASSALILLSPLLLLVPLIIKITSPGPVVFRLRAAGRFGKPFDQLKFRTMVHGARQKDHPFETSQADPRITWIGRILRRWSVDELPQLVNILRGEMSLVGPRPTFIELRSHFSNGAERRFFMRPGLTGLAQIHGRNLLSWQEKIFFDLDYVDHFSLLRDLKILIRTVPSLIRGEGVYGQDGRVRMPEPVESSALCNMTNQN